MSIDCFKIQVNCIVSLWGNRKVIRRHHRHRTLYYFCPSVEKCTTIYGIGNKRSNVYLLRWQLLPRITYSLDLARPDYHLFNIIQSLHYYLIDTRLKTREQIGKSVIESLDSKKLRLLFVQRKFENFAYCTYFSIFPK